MMLRLTKLYLKSPSAYKHNPFQAEKNKMTLDSFLYSAIFFKMFIEEKMRQYIAKFIFKKIKRKKILFAYGRFVPKIVYLPVLLPNKIRSHWESCK